MFHTSNQIHPTAIIDGQIEMGENNQIGPYAILQGRIRLGSNNTIGAGVHISNHVEIGNDNRLFPYVTIGGIGEMGAKGDRINNESFVRIGDRVTLREYVTIHSPVYYLTTAIGNDVYIMNKGYVAHDGHVEAGVILNAGVSLGGRCTVQTMATIGMGATVHPQCAVGTMAMVGMQTPVTLPVIPFSKVAGSPARILGFNSRGAARKYANEEWLTAMEAHFKQLNSIEKHQGENEMVDTIISFMKAHPDALVKMK